MRVYDMASKDERIGYGGSHFKRSLIVHIPDSSQDVAIQTLLALTCYVDLVSSPVLVRKVLVASIAYGTILRACYRGSSQSLP